MTEKRTAKALVRQQEKDRGRKYTTKQKKFLQLLVEHDFKHPTRLMKDAGYATGCWNTVYSLKDDIKQLAEAVLIAHAPTAALSITDILESDKPIPNVNAKLSAAREVLDRVGITKEERVKHQHEHQGGIFLIPAKTAPSVIQKEDVIEGELDEH